MTLRGKVGLIFIVGMLLVVVAILVTRSETLTRITGHYLSVDEVVEHDEHEEEDENHAPLEKRMVRIEDDIGEYAGIKVSSLEISDFSPEIRASAVLVDLRPLLDLRSRYYQTLASVNVAKVVERSARDELARLKRLAKGVAAKKVNYALAVQGEAKAKLQGVRSELSALRDESSHSFGSEITKWLLDADSKQWQRLLAHQDALLLVTLPVNDTLAANVSMIRVAHDGDRDKARKAYFVSPAFMSDHEVQGENYFFKTSGIRLRANQRLDAWLPQGNTALSGVFIPNNAIVWYEGQKWVYVEVGDDLYQRRLLSEQHETVGGVFIEVGIESGFELGDELVIVGAQMLLSEEFKWQIPEEDDDDEDDD